MQSLAKSTHDKVVKHPHIAALKRRVLAAVAPVRKAVDSLLQAVPVRHFLGFKALSLPQRIKSIAFDCRSQHFGLRLGRQRICRALTLPVRLPSREAGKAESVIRADRQGLVPAQA